MSGGYAFVLDLDTKLVNQSALRSGELELTPLSDESALIVRDLLERHVAETESEYARRLLDEWETTRNRITAVTPRDFRKVTLIRERAATEGRDPDGDAVWSEIMEVAGG